MYLKGYVLFGKSRTIEFLSFLKQDTVLALFGIRSTKHLDDNQKTILTSAFSDNPYPSKQDKMHLANELGLNYKQIEQWFWNRRHKVAKVKK